MSLISNIRETLAKDLYLSTFVATAFSSLWFYITWRYDFDLADEGFYWYGAQRILQGEVPLRDFMSYDIGRYYWTAGFFSLFGDDSLFTARLSAYVFQIIGITLGTLICLQASLCEYKTKIFFSILVACILITWMIPYYKIFDHVASIVIVATLFVVINKNTPAHWFITGVVLGIIAVIGRNHGIYGLVACAVAVLLNIKFPNLRHRAARKIILFLIGLILGFSPTFVVALNEPGFRDAFIHSIISLIMTKSTNIGLAVPWPWTVHYAGRASIPNYFVGLGFIALLVFPIVGLWRLLANRSVKNDSSRALLLVSVSTSIPYAHYAFSRADLTHLAWYSLARLRF